MQDFIRTSFKQAPWLKFDFLEIVAGSGKEIIGGGMFCSPEKLSKAYKGINFYLIDQKAQCYYKSISS